MAGRDANIGADQNPGGAGVWELPGTGRSKPAFGGRHFVWPGTNWPLSMWAGV